MSDQSTFIDPLEDIMKRHQDVMNGKTPVVDTEDEEDIYGVNDRAKQEAAELEAEEKARQEKLEQMRAEAAEKESLTQMPPQSLDPAFQAESINFQTTNLEIVSRMVDEVAKKHNLTSGGIPESTDNDPNLRMHVMGDLMEQYHKRKAIFTAKWPNGIPYAYFQSYTNTYNSLDNLKTIYQPFLDNEEIGGIVIATRSDCLDDEKISWLNSLSAVKPIWLELGLQSIHDQTLKEMNRGHDFKNFRDCISKLADTDLKVSVHLINGWMSETEEMMLQTAKVVGQMPIQAVKFHMLHICKNTPLGQLYQKQPFELLSKQQYTHLVARQLTYLRPDIIIERLTGDGLKEQLLAPLWTLKKVSVINDIDKDMAANDYWQGKNYEEIR